MHRRMHGAGLMLLSSNPNRKGVEESLIAHCCALGINSDHGVIDLFTKISVSRFRRVVNLSNNSRAECAHGAP